MKWKNKRTRLSKRTQHGNRKIPNSVMFGDYLEFY